MKKNNDTFYAAPSIKVVAIASSRRILSESNLYGEPGEPGDYDSDNDNNYGIL